MFLNKEDVEVKIDNVIGKYYNVKSMRIKE